MTAEDANVIGDAIAKILQPFVERLEALDGRTKALETRPPGVQYRGVWSDSQLYALDQAVTHAGSLWIARSASIGQRPGVNLTAWQLAVKKGSDGKAAPADG